MPRPEVAVASLFVAFLAREGVAAVVGIAGFALVEQRFSPWHILQMLIGGTVGVGHPRGAAQMVAVLPIGGVVRTPVKRQAAKIDETIWHNAVGGGIVHLRLLGGKRRGCCGMGVETSDGAIANAAGKSLALNEIKKIILH